MTKDYSSYRKYIELVNSNKDFFNSYYYHAIIDNDFIKLASILGNGILSKNERDNFFIHTASIHDYKDYDSKNGTDFISLSECKFSYNPLFDSFALHTLSSVSFLVSKEIKTHSKGEKISLFDDEVFVRSKVSIESILGILVPSHLFNSGLRSIPLMGTNYHSLSTTGVFSYLKSIENFFGQLPDIDLLKEKHLELLEIISNMENGCNFTGTALRKQKEKTGLDFLDVYSSEVTSLWEEKLRIKDAKVKDVIEFLNQNKRSVYVIDDKAMVLAKKC